MLSRSNLMTNPNNSPLVTTRIGAIGAAVFDAVNDGRYAPVHVPPGRRPGHRGARPPSRRPTPRYCSRPTAQYPSMKTALDGKRAASLAVIAADPRESASSVAGGSTGQSVAEAIVAWRSTDGFTPRLPRSWVAPRWGNGVPSRPASPPGAGPQFATMRG